MGVSLKMGVDIKFGDAEHFLHIIRTNPSDPYSSFSVSSKAVYDDSIFAGNHNNVLFESSDDRIAEFDSFERLDSDQCLIGMTEGCSIALRRITRGQIEISYNIARRRIDAEVSGVIVIDGEYSMQLYRDFRRLLFDAK